MSTGQVILLEEGWTEVEEAISKLIDILDSDKKKTSAKPFPPKVRL